MMMMYKSMHIYIKQFNGDDNNDDEDDDDDDVQMYVCIN